MAFPSLEYLAPKRGRFAQYIPLSSSNADGGVYGTNHQSATKSFIRIPSGRALLIWLFLLLELLVGYSVGRWYAQPSKGVVHTPMTGDYFFHPPTDGEHFPKVAKYNQLPPDFTLLKKLQLSQSPVTPLFIPFTRNSEMVAQTVLSYIAAGWPREEIIVIENTGTMDANPNGLLTNRNPFYLDYPRLRERYGVSILQTPTYLSFAQIQNFMLSTAMSKGWKYYYWSHQDIAVLSNETAVPYKSFYQNTLESLSKLKETMEEDPSKGKQWAARFYNFDWLTLVNVGAIQKVGAWDTFIPYYNSDCDWYERARLSGLTVDEERVGLIFDLHRHIQEPEERYFGNNPNQGPNSERFTKLRNELQRLMDQKNEPEADRNIWQNEQKGGKGEPWTYNPRAFQKAWWNVAEGGRKLFEQKWGTTECSVIGAGKTLNDMWAPHRDP